MIVSGSVAVSAAAVSKTVTGAFPTPPYQIVITTDWASGDCIPSVQTVTGFTITFGNPPNASGTMWYLVIGALATNSVLTSLDICNNALLLIGDATITSLSQDVPRATILNAFYVPTLDECLRMHDWNFASVRMTLKDSLTCGPEYDFTYQYALPCAPYCLIVRETDLDDNEPWRIEYGCSQGTKYRVLVTDGCQPSILYIARIDDVSYWDPLFTDAFTYELAFRIAYPLTRNATLSTMLQKEKEERWQKAKSRDGQEGRALKRMLSTSFTQVRY